MELGPKELEIAQELIDKLIPGCEYELKDIYGEKWSEIVSPTTFGKRFKKSVVTNSLAKIVYFNRKLDNHCIYRKL